MGYLTDFNECTDPVAGDYLLIADASAGATDRDRRVNAGKFAILTEGNIFTNYVTAAAARTGFTASVANNGVYSFTPFKTRGLIILSANTGSMAATIGILHFDTVAPATAALVVGASLNAATGVLTGTTGTSGKATCSSHTDGKIYLENRIGTAINWSYLII